MVVRFLTLVIGLLCLACSNEASEATRLVLVSDTDMPELDQVRFSVRAPSGRMQEATAPVGRGAPGWLVMNREDGSLGPYDITVTGLSLGTPAVERVARVSFVRGQTLTVLLHLVQACSLDMPLRCDAGQVCSHTGCRSVQIGNDELDPFTGVPPRLPNAPVDDDAGSAKDAGPVEDAGPVDAGPSTRDASVDADGGTCSVCEQPGFCQHAECVEGSCATRAADEGETCGSGLTCMDGVCGGTSCATGNCSPSCNTDVAQCDLDCAGSTRCLPSCPAGQRCDIHCGSVTACVPSCSGACTIDCGSATSCRTGCSGQGATCDVSCQGANCARIECTGGARCSLTCQGAAACAFRKCDNGPAVTCGDGSVVCNRACP